MKAKNPKPDVRAGSSSEPSSGPCLEATPSGVSRREFFNVGLAAAALLALTGCASFRGSKSDLDKATTDLRKLLEGFEGDGARQARLASIGHRIENRCREVIELKSDFTQQVGGPFPPARDAFGGAHGARGGLLRPSGNVSEGIVGSPG